MLNINPVITLLYENLEPSGSVIVFASAENSNFQNIPRSDCVYEWDFGDANCPGSEVSSLSRDAFNLFQKNRSFVWSRHSETNDENILENKQHGNLDQKSLIAGYVYLHDNSGNPFQIRMRIGYGGEWSEWATLSFTVNSFVSKDWTTIQVNSAVSATSHPVYKTLSEAIDYANSTGKVIVELSKVGDFADKTSSKITISGENIWIRPKSSGDTLCFLSGNTTLNASTNSIFEISGKNILFSDVYFGSYNSNEASNLTAFEFASECENFALLNCGFWGLRRIAFSPNNNQPKNILISNCVSQTQFPTNAIDLSCQNLILRSFRFGAATNGFPTDENHLIHIGHRFTAKNVLIESCHFSLNNTSTTSPNGAISIYATQNIWIRNNNLGFGSNLISDANECRIDGNDMATGGTKSCLLFAGTSNNKVGIFNNFFETRSTIGPSLFSLQTPNTDAIINLKIVHNTIFANKSVSHLSALFDFTGNVSGVEISNNLTFKNGISFVSKFVKLPADYGSKSLVIRNNIWPKTVSGTDCALPIFLIGTTTYTESQWTNLGLETNSVFLDLSPNDTEEIWNWKFDVTEWPQINTTRTTHNSVFYDRLGQSVSSVGCVSVSGARFPRSGDALNFTFDVESVARSISGMGNNFRLTILDNARTTTNSAGTSVSRKILRPSSNYLVFGNQASPCLRGMGEWISTNVSATNVSTNRVDIRITYQNIGPANQSENDIRARLGEIFLGELSLGSSFTRILNNDFSNSQTINNLNVNTNFTTMPYPGDRFSPTFNFFNSEYSLGISLQYDIRTQPRTIDETWRSGDVYSDEYGSSVPYSGVYLRSGTNSVDHSRNPHILFNFASEDGSPTTTTLSDSNSEGLKFGETFVVVLSITVNKNPKEWVKTLQSYKDFFATTYGGTTYARDPRPLCPFVPAGNEAAANNGFKYRDGAGYGDPSKTSNNGWETNSNFIKSLYNDYGFDRIMMWSVAGMYTGNDGNAPNKYDYPFYVLSPLFRNDTPHSLSSFNGVDVSSKLKSTINLLQSATREVPSFAIYQGYSRKYHTQWNPANDSMVITLNNSNYSTYIQKFFDEQDLGRLYFNISTWGMDALSDRPFSTNNQYLADIRNRHPDMKLINEISLYDVVCKDTASFFFGRIPNGPSILQNFILPSNEILLTTEAAFYTSYTTLGISNNLYYTLYTSTYKASLEQMKTCAKWGYSPSTYDPAIMVTPSNYYAENRDYDFANYPDGVTENLVAPQTPTGLNYSVSYVQNFNTTYSLNSRLVRLFWNANTESDFSHYKVYRSKIVNGVVSTDTFVIRSYVKRNEFYDQILDNQNMYYKISAVDIFGNESSLSSPITVLPNGPVVSQPEGKNKSSGNLKVIGGKLYISNNDIQRTRFLDL